MSGLPREPARDARPVAVTGRPHTRPRQARGGSGTGARCLHQDPVARAGRPVLTSQVSRESGEVLLYELWSDETVFDEFLQQPQMVEYLQELDAMLVSRDIRRWTPSSVLATAASHPTIGDERA